MSRQPGGTSSEVRLFCLHRGLASTLLFFRAIKLKGADELEVHLQQLESFCEWEGQVETGAPRFLVNTPTGYARGLTDAGMLGDKTFYLSTGGWKYDNPNCWKRQNHWEAFLKLN